MWKLFYLSILAALVILAILLANAQPQVETIQVIQPQIDIVQIQAVKDSEGALIPKFDLELRISRLPEMYIKAMLRKPGKTTEIKPKKVDPYKGNTIRAQA